MSNVQVDYDVLRGELHDVATVADERVVAEATVKGQLAPDDRSAPPWKPSAPSKAALCQVVAW